MLQIVHQWKEQTDRAFPIVAFGSSNTELSWGSGGRHNWVDWLNINLRAHIGHHVNVINQGIGGETAADLLLRIERDVFSYRPAIVIVTIGGNDANRGFTLRQYSDNLHRICSLIRESGALPVLQTYYCPAYHLGDAGFRSAFESFMQEVRNIAQRMNIPLVDAYKRFEPFYRKRPDQYVRLMSDLLHVNYLGNLIMGMHISNYFGLPTIPIPEDIREEALDLIGQMNDCCDE